MKRRLMAVVLAALLVLGIVAGPAMVVSADTIYGNNILNVVVSSDDGFANLRNGAGMTYGIITPIYNGTSLRVTEVTQNSYDGIVWGHTSYNGYNGWVAMEPTVVTDVENASVAIYDVTVNQANNIYLRRGPGAEYDSIYRPYNGQGLRIDRTVVNSFDGRPWGRTSINGMQGWVSLNWTYRNNGWTYNQSQDVTFYNNQYNVYVSASDGYLNLRTGAGLAYGIITPIYNGTNLYITAVLDNSSDGLVWGLTSYNGNTGWVSMSQTTVNSISNAGTAQYSVTVQNSGNISLRKGPGTEYDTLVGYIPNGTGLYITQTVINSFDGRPWGKTTVNGMQGWVSLNWTYR